MLFDKYAHRNTFLAVRAVRSVNVSTGATKSMLDQLVVGLHVHVHMWIGKCANRLPVVQITAWLRGGCKEIEFYLIVHGAWRTVAFIEFRPETAICNPINEVIIF